LEPEIILHLHLGVVQGKDWVGFVVEMDWGEFPGEMGWDSAPEKDFERLSDRGLAAFPAERDSFFEGVHWFSVQAAWLAVLRSGPADLLS
jgi:hypothetical protein